MGTRDKDLSRSRYRGRKIFAKVTEPWMGLKYNCNNLGCPHAVRMSLNQSGKIGIYIRNITTQKRKIAQPTHTISMQERTISLKLLSNGTHWYIICSYLRFQQTRHTLTTLTPWKVVLGSTAGWLVWACWSVRSQRRRTKPPGKLATICKPKKPKCCSQ